MGILQFQSIRVYFRLQGMVLVLWGNAPQSIRTQAILSDSDIEAILGGITIIKVELKKGYKNLNIKTKDSKTMIKKLEELMKRIEEDKKQ